MVNDITEMCDFCLVFRFPNKADTEIKVKNIFVWYRKFQNSEQKLRRRDEYSVFSSNEEILSQRSVRTARIQLEYSELFGYITTNWLLCRNGGLRTLIKRYG